MQTAPGTDHARRYGEAVEALNKRDWQQAQHVSMHLLREIPPNGSVYLIAGVAARELQQTPLAIQCLERAVQLSPTRADYMAQLARALAQASESAKALDAADRALLLPPPSDPMTYDTLGVVYRQIHQYDRAAEMFRRVVEMQPEQAHFRFNYATSLIHAGDVDGAERELETCLRLDPHMWKAHLTLAQLRKQTQSRNHLQRLQELLPKAGQDASAPLCLNLALSKEYEDIGDYQKAFTHLVAGKASCRTRQMYSSANDETLFAALMDAFPREVPNGHPNAEPIFVFGMPRTGTTLIDRIISSHPDVYSAGELQNFGMAIKRASGSRTPPMLDVDTIQRTRSLDWKQVGEQYIESTRPSTGRRPRFIDKLPHNFLHAGFIASALPNAKLICLRRNPMDTCLSNFRQLFALNSAYCSYSFDLLDTGRYYVMFDRLMSFWRQQMPGRILEIDYETVVDQQEESTHRLLDFCGLDWDDACLSFEKNQAPVSTASAVQVRSPMYRSALNRWKRYDSELGELKQLLTDSGISIGD
jgi:tetratricopeptide (TPR) repeat protein